MIRLGTRTEAEADVLTETRKKVIRNLRDRNHLRHLMTQPIDQTNQTGTKDSH
jgi:hypothetical protein